MGWAGEESGWGLGGYQEGEDCVREADPHEGLQLWVVVGEGLAVVVVLHVPVGVENVPIVALKEGVGLPVGDAVWPEAETETVADGDAERRDQVPLFVPVGMPVRLSVTVGEWVHVKPDHEAELRLALAVLILSDGERVVAEALTVGVGDRERVQLLAVRALGEMLAVREEGLSVYCVGERDGVLREGLKVAVSEALAVPLSDKDPVWVERVSPEPVKDREPLAVGAVRVRQAERLSVGVCVPEAVEAETVPAVDEGVRVHDARDRDTDWVGDWV